LTDGQEGIDGIVIQLLFQYRSKLALAERILSPEVHLVEYLSLNGMTIPLEVVYTRFCITVVGDWEDV